MGLDASTAGVARDRTRPSLTASRAWYVHFQEELETSVSPTYMRRQAHINEKMRAILIDWLVGAPQFKLGRRASW